MLPIIISYIAGLVSGALILLGVALFMKDDDDDDHLFPRTP